MKAFQVLSSPYYKPIEKLNLRLLENLALGKCQLCDCFVEIGHIEKNKFANLTRENIDKAIGDNKGLIFWNREVATRKNELGIRETDDGKTYERRYICPDCIENFFSQFKLKE